MQLCGHEVGLDQSVSLKVGPCVIESEAFALETAQMLQEMPSRVGIPLIYKSPFYKSDRCPTRSLARAATDVGIAGLLMETHPEPEKVLSDGPSVWPLGQLKPPLETLSRLDIAAKSRDFAEEQYLQGQVSS